MDIKSTAHLSKVVIGGLLTLLENSDIDINSVKFEAQNENGEVELEQRDFSELVSLALFLLDEVIESDNSEEEHF